MTRLPMILLVCLILLASLNGAVALEVRKTVLFPLPSDLDRDTLIGMRTSGANVHFADRQGHLVVANLDSETIEERRVWARPIRDFTLDGPQSFLFLDREGVLVSEARTEPLATCPGACEIEANTDGILAYGAGVSQYLARGATQSTPLPEVPLGQFMRHDFLWALRWEATRGVWTLDLVDACGNLMKQVYQFSRTFRPSGMRLGPTGPEGEVLISFWTGRKRELALVGQNGRMLWRMDGPTQSCPRDVAWDSRGRLLVIESVDGRLCLCRWEFAAPQG